MWGEKEGGGGLAVSCPVDLIKLYEPMKKKRTTPPPLARHIPSGSAEIFGRLW